MGMPVHEMHRQGSDINGKHAENGGRRRADGVEHRRAVLQPVFNLGGAGVGRAIGESGAAAVEADQAGEGRQPAEEARHAGVFPLDVQVAPEPGRVDEIPRPLTHDLVGDAIVADGGELGFWLDHGRVGFYEEDTPPP